MRYMLVVLPFLVAGLATQAKPGPQSQSSARTAEEREVLATIDRFFAAVHDKDRATMLASVIPEGLATGVRMGEGPQPFMRSWHWATYIENQTGSPQRFVERLFGPEIKVEGEVAMVWARYELLVDGSFDHCGVDHFDLVRRDGKWLVYNLTWTNQKSGCPGR
jgi:hypothetical protein